MKLHFVDINLTCPYTSVGPDPDPQTYSWWETSVGRSGNLRPCKVPFHTQCGHEVIMTTGTMRPHLCAWGFLFNRRNLTLEPYIVFKTDEKLSCVFNTIVIKNESLMAHYPCGLKGFIENHPSARCNAEITVYLLHGSRYWGYRKGT